MSSPPASESERGLWAGFGGSVTLRRVSSLAYLTAQIGGRTRGDKRTPMEKQNHSNGLYGRMMMMMMMMTMMMTMMRGDV
jgi:hypothetical protein